MLIPWDILTTCIALLEDGAGKSKDSAEIYADDEFGVQAGHL